MHYLYQRKGGPLLVWDAQTGVPPSQSRAADATSLGDWAPIRPGAPEVIGDANLDAGRSFLAGIVVGALALHFWRRRPR